MVLMFDSIVNRITTKAYCDGSVARNDARIASGMSYSTNHKINSRANLLFTTLRLTIIPRVLCERRPSSVWYRSTALSAKQ